MCPISESIWLFGTSLGYNQETRYFWWNSNSACHYADGTKISGHQSIMNADTVTIWELFRLTTPQFYGRPSLCGGFWRRKLFCTIPPEGFGWVVGESYQDLNTRPANSKAVFLSKNISTAACHRKFVSFFPQEYFCQNICFQSELWILHLLRSWLLN